MIKEIILKPEYVILKSCKQKKAKREMPERNSDLD